MFSIIESVVLIITCLFLLHKYVTRNNDYFLKKNIPYQKPFLWFGNFFGCLTGSESILESLIRFDSQFKDEKVYGMFDFGGPVIVLRDPEIIKQITIKDSDHFINHRELITDQDDSMFGNSIFQLRDQKWKDMRSTLTPAFTENKMRIMFDLIRECCNETVGYLKNELKSNPNEIELDLKDFCTRFTNDVIATTAFGTKVNSLADRKNKFYLMWKKISSFDFWTTIKFIVIVNFKMFARMIGLNLFSKNHIEYFKSLVLDAMKYRQEHNIVRPDMINMLMEARSATDKKRDWTDNEIVAQCFNFFMAGFETTGTTIAFGITELMLNEDIQRKLIAEVDDVREKLNGKPITYDILLGMNYLDMVVSETLRKWPGAQFVERQCSKSYVLNVDDEQKIQLKVGDTCSLNVFGLHYDPENFPDPKKFDPERFGEENKINLKPYTYLPFGVGPRNCIGNRFALMEIKAILYSLLCEFKFKISKKTILPIKLENRGLQLKPKCGFWTILCSRK